MPTQGTGGFFIPCSCRALLMYCCIPGALSQAGESLVFQPVNGTYVLTARFADTLKECPCI